MKRFLGFVSLLWAAAASAGGPVTFTDLAEDPASGLAYSRVPSVTQAVIDAVRLDSLTNPLPPGLLPLPAMPRGLPGVVLFDHDGDGDLDIYVTNGPGAGNSLFSNQLDESGLLAFVDVGVASGAGAADQDSFGACAGDLDNDGDPDLVVLGRDEPNRLFENLGGGAFAEHPGTPVSAASLGSTGCSLGDFDGDGLLDLVVANVFDFTAPPNPFGPLFPEMHANELFLNQGGFSFADVSVTSGIRDLAGLPPGADGRTVTWALAVVDIDQDGDVDVILADDQGPVPTAAYGGLDVGLIHVLLNDGTGQLTDVPFQAGPTSAGSWMGLSFGDLDCNGTLDILGSNFGDYGFSVLGLPYALEDQATRWLYGNGDGTFTDPGLGASISSVFGWGNAVADLDNDGDPDLVVHGGMDLATLLLADNPGAVLLNGDPDDGACTGDFSYDPLAVGDRHTRRNVRGMAAGDLSGDGFVDLVSAASLTAPPVLPLVPMPVAYGSPFDAVAFFTSVFAPTPDGLVWTGLSYGPGNLSVEINSADNGHHGVGVRTLGSVGLTPGGAVNRDGVGAVVTVTPKKGVPATVPVVAGSSHLSQHELTARFGLGKAPWGRVDILWPGGTKNRLYRIRRDETLTLPEIPCSYDDAWPSFSAYLGCVRNALKDLHGAGVIDGHLKTRLFVSALLAFLEEQS